MSTPAAAVPDDLVPVARVVDAYGIRGWLKLETFSGDAPALQSAKQWWIAARGADARPLVPAEVKAHSGYYVAKLAGIDDRDAALALKGARIAVARAEFPAADGDEYYWVDLIGCAVESASGQVLGQVVEVMENGAHAILAVQPAVQPSGSGEASAVELIPFVEAFVSTVDTKARRIVVDWAFGQDAGS